MPNGGILSRNIIDNEILIDMKYGFNFLTFWTIPATIFTNQLDQKKIITITQKNKTFSFDQTVTKKKNKPTII